ncbi:hypothetical protein IB238_05505 [Rhizobium sp. ARZ01]|uniref:hypothetical protein n=1 Tax=Rhizobium sp. ARZ01 TaxID=2769313 RepID=UPI00177EC89D|nr:hypothetical protein [Rhizobium sp. ARZ01]MBD9372085.1 hypothetical protein [Rhizobium sp. ARZ01]
MRQPRFPRYPIEQIDADWSNIDRRRAAIARADRICNLVVYLLVPTVAIATILLSIRWS